MKALRMAFAFLTVLPPGRLEGAAMAPARAFFPLVGLALGGLLAASNALLGPVFPPLMTGALLAVALVVLTRGLHLDGLMDTCDGLFGGAARERRLEIMRDHHVGAFGVLAGSSALLLKWAALASLSRGVLPEALLLFPCFSRWGMLLAMQAFPYARQAGLGTVFQERRVWHVAVGLTTALGVGVLLAGVTGLALFVLATALALALGWWMAHLLGGLTGDTYGAVNELVEIAVLLAMVAMAGSVAYHPWWSLPWGTMSP